MAAELVTEVGDVGTLQVRQRHYHKLLAGGLLMGLKLLAELLAHRWLDHLRSVDHPPRQRRKAQLGAGNDRHHPQQQQQACFQDAHWQPLAW
ncbi:hypothetical protein D9M69_659170 [compost metagenome]